MVNDKRGVDYPVDLPSDLPSAGCLRPGCPGPDCRQEVPGNGIARWPGCLLRKTLRRLSDFHDGAGWRAVSYSAANACKRAQGGETVTSRDRNDRGRRNCKIFRAVRIGLTWREAGVSPSPHAAFSLAPRQRRARRRQALRFDSRSARSVADYCSASMALKLRSRRSGAGLPNRLTATAARVLMRKPGMIS